MPHNQASAGGANNVVKDTFFHEEMRMEELSKVMKFANSLLNGNPSLAHFNVESSVMQALNVVEFIHALQLLE
jgi:hypothetical protein